MAGREETVWVVNKTRLLMGDVRHCLQTLPTDSIHCCVTSPPYWGLRDYGTEPLVWCGEPGCEHEWGEEIKGTSQSGSLNGSTLEGGKPGNERRPKWESSFCRLCGAWRGNYGLEPTIDLYIQHTVEIFREVRRVLRADGVLFLNLGSSYASGGRTAYDVDPKLPNRGHSSRPGSCGKNPTPSLPAYQNVKFKPKDLIMVPAMVALALQADGWWLRSDIIWSKKNCMPESCTDRPTKSHEYVFLLTKSANYFWDQEAVKEKSTGQNGAAANFQRETKDHLMPEQSAKQHRIDRKPTEDTGSRNLRTVWEIATYSFPEAHFATYPPELVRRCVAAGTSEKGCCPKCGAPWKRVVEKKGGTTGKSWHNHEDDLGRGMRGGDNRHNEAAAQYHTYSVSTTGWAPTCTCNSNLSLRDDLTKEEIAYYLGKDLPPLLPVPATVLDPFGGSGTTALVSAKMGRDAVLIELKPEYCDMAAKRIKKDLGMLTEIQIDTFQEIAV